MRHKFIDEIIAYNGTQLRSHFTYQLTGLAGDSIMSFIGPADVKGDNLVDLEDKKSSQPIYSPKMLHFIIEHFQPGLDLIISRQRLFIVVACEELNRLIHSSFVTRKGDDIFHDNRKLSVSIATCSPVSTLIHTGINIQTKNTPVPAIGLEEMGIDPRGYADALMLQYIEEIEGMKRAGWKVRSVP